MSNIKQADTKKSCCDVAVVWSCAFFLWNTCLFLAVVLVYLSIFRLLLSQVLFWCNSSLFLNKANEIFEIASSIYMHKHSVLLSRLCRLSWYVDFQKQNDSLWNQISNLQQSSLNNNTPQNNFGIGGSWYYTGKNMPIRNNSWNSKSGQANYDFG